MLIANDYFQGMCLVSVRGSETIDEYDRLPKPVRDILKHSPFNICAACVRNACHGEYEAAPGFIKALENQIRGGDHDDHQI